MPKRKPSLLNFFRQVDFFGSQVGFNLNGDSQVPTTVGAIVSLFIIFITIVYANSKVQVMLDYGDTTFQDTHSDIDHQ